MLSNETAILLLKVFMGCSVIGTILGFMLFSWKNKIIATIGKIFFILATLSIMGMLVLVFTMSNQPKQDNQVAVSETVGSASFAEIYLAYKENELRANETYQYNRYRITAKVNGMSTGGLLNLTGGATLTMEKRVGKTTVFFLAEFDRHQEEDLKLIKVGDTITFEGKCLSAGSWTDCELIFD